MKKANVRCSSNAKKFGAAGGFKPSQCGNLKVSSTKGKFAGVFFVVSVAEVFRPPRFTSFYGSLKASATSLFGWKAKAYLYIILQSVCCGSYFQL